MPQPNVFWWQKYGTLAQMAQASVALLGFVAVLIQVNEIRSNNRANAARQVYLGYNDLEFRNPRFAKPDYERIKAAPSDEQVQYESFVSYFLYACEEALAVYLDEPVAQVRKALDAPAQPPHVPFEAMATRSRKSPAASPDRKSVV